MNKILKFTQQNHLSSGKYWKSRVDQDTRKDMRQCQPWLHKENSVVRHHTDNLTQSTKKYKKTPQNWNINYTTLCTDDQWLVQSKVVWGFELTVDSDPTDAMIIFADLHRETQTGSLDVAGFKH